MLHIRFASSKSIHASTGTRTVGASVGSISSAATIPREPHGASSTWTSRGSTKPPCSLIHCASLAAESPVAGAKLSSTDLTAPHWKWYLGRKPRTCCWGRLLLLSVCLSLPGDIRRTAETLVPRVRDMRDERQVLRANATKAGRLLRPGTPCSAATQWPGVCSRGWENVYPERAPNARSGEGSSRGFGFTYLPAAGVECAHVGARCRARGASSCPPQAAPQARAAAAVMGGWGSTTSTACATHAVLVRPPTQTTHTCGVRPRTCARGGAAGGG
eukprot:scaffold2989_cov387-Prasinococcus_capsulatus_cf.AAC.2